MHAPKRIHTIADFRLTTESIDADLRTMLRKHTRRIATFRENSDRAHGQIFGGVCDGFADRFSNRITMILTAAAPWRRQVRDTRFGLPNDARHHGHGLAGITAPGGFFRKHDHSPAP